MKQPIEFVGTQGATYTQQDAKRFAREHGASTARLVEFLMFGQVRGDCMAREFHAEQGFRDAGYTGSLGGLRPEPARAIPALAIQFKRQAEAAKALRDAKDASQAAQRRVADLKAALAEAEAAAAEAERHVEIRRELSAQTTATTRAALAAAHDAETAGEKFKYSSRGNLISRDGVVNVGDVSSAIHRGHLMRLVGM